MTSNNTTNGAKTMTNQLNATTFNAVADLLGTTDKGLVFNTCIMTLIEAGMSVQESVDAVLGAGSFRRIADTVYDRLAAQK